MPHEDRPRASQSSSGQSRRQSRDNDADPTDAPARKRSRLIPSASEPASRQPSRTPLPFRMPFASGTTGQHALGPISTDSTHIPIRTRPDSTASASSRDGTPLAVPRPQSSLRKSQSQSQSSVSNPGVKAISDNIAQMREDLTNLSKRQNCRGLE